MAKVDKRKKRQISNFDTLNIETTSVDESCCLDVIWKKEGRNIPKEYFKIPM